MLDRAVVKRNCDAMLQVCKQLGVGFRAHVKSHKTVELSRLQVGEDGDGAAEFIVSTVVEAEHLLELVRGAQEGGREASVRGYFFFRLPSFFFSPFSPLRFLFLTFDCFSFRYPPFF